MWFATDTGALSFTSITVIATEAVELGGGSKKKISMFVAVTMKL